MTNQRRFNEGKTRRNDLSRRSSDKAGKELLTDAQLELNRIKKNIANKKEEISLIPEKEECIRTFFERNAKPVFEKETALKYKYLFYLDESFESHLMSTQEESTLIYLFTHESQGVEDFLTTDDQRDRLLELKYKYDELMLGLNRESLIEKAVERALSLFIYDYGVRRNAEMAVAQTLDQLFSAVSDYIDRRELKALTIATGEKPKRATGKSKEVEKRIITKRSLIERLEMAQSLKEMRTVYLDMINIFYEYKEDDEACCAEKEERIKQLAIAAARKNLAALLIMQIEWIEEAALKAPVEKERELAVYNTWLNLLLERLYEQLDIIEEAPLFGVEEPYCRLRNFAWKNLPTQLNLLFSHHKRGMRGIEEYVQSVSSIQGLKYFLKQYEQIRH